MYVARVLCLLVAIAVLAGAQISEDNAAASLSLASQLRGFLVDMWHDPYEAATRYFFQQRDSWSSLMLWLAETAVLAFITAVAMFIVSLVITCILYIIHRVRYGKFPYQMLQQSTAKKTD